VVNYKVNKAGLVDIVGAVRKIFKGRSTKLDVYANEVLFKH
jgi:hypothetical protein